MKNSATDKLKDTGNENSLYLILLDIIIYRKYIDKKRLRLLQYIRIAGQKVEP